MTYATYYKTSIYLVNRDEQLNVQSESCLLNARLVVSVYLGLTGHMFLDRRFQLF